MDISLVDWVGYLAGAVVFWSFYYSDMTKLRKINMLGAVLFMIYGVMLKYAYPIIIFNGGIILFHFYHLSKKSTSNEQDSN